MSPSDRTEQSRERAREGMRAAILEEAIRQFTAEREQRDTPAS